MGQRERLVELRRKRNSVTADHIPFTNLPFVDTETAYCSDGVSIASTEVTRLYTLRMCTDRENLESGKNKCNTWKAHGKKRESCTKQGILKFTDFKSWKTHGMRNGIINFKMHQIYTVLQFFSATCLLTICSALGKATARQPDIQKIV